jgi:hypothetical protein
MSFMHHLAFNIKYFVKKQLSGLMDFPYRYKKCYLAYSYND